MISTMPNVYFSHEICRVCEMPISMQNSRLSREKTNYVSFMSYNIDLGIYMKIYTLK